jgi:glycosyltransferase involved in cell wall biosynthesis
MSTIHVLHVLGGVGLGGAESRIMDLYRQMDRDEIQFDFWVHQNDTSVRKPQFYDDEIKSLGGHIYVLPKFKGYNYFAYRKAITAFFEKHHEFNVVQGHMTSTAGIYLPIAKKSGVPITVAHSRNAGVEKGVKGIATRFFRHNLAKKADFLFACSELAARDVFGDRAVEQGEVKIIHNAIDVRRFTFDEKQRDRMREKLGLADKLVLGHVGRFNYQKNHPYLIDIFAAVCEKRDDAVLLLLGEGPDMDVIKEKCRRLNIFDKVIFAGNQKETEKYYQAMDVFLLPSFLEGLPGVLMEAQAAGLRCFVSDAVTREAKATDLVTYLSIEQPPENWADEILKTASCERRDTYEELAAAGFDVRQQADAYRAFYQKGDASKL